MKILAIILLWAVLIAFALWLDHTVGSSNATIPIFVLGMIGVVLSSELAQYFDRRK